MTVVEPPTSVAGVAWPHPGHFPLDPHNLAGYKVVVGTLQPQEPPMNKRSADTPRTAIVTAALTVLEARALDRLVALRLLSGERTTRSSILRELLLPHLTTPDAINP